VYLVEEIKYVTYYNVFVSVLGVMVLHATFNSITVISWWSVIYEWRTPKYPKKTTDLSQVIEKRYQIKLYRGYLAMRRI
jgi:hypothetical protein